MFAIEISRERSYVTGADLAKRNVTNERARAVIGNYIGIEQRPALIPVVNTFRYFDTLNTRRMP